MLVNLKEVLADAQKNKYAVGLFNTQDTDMLEAVISAAEELRSPVILGTAEVLLKYGEFKLIAPALIEMAKRATVPVVVHFDHGLTFERCMEALKFGFSSLMFDGSAGSPEENIRKTREIVRIAHAFGASVEGEIGHVGETVTNDEFATDSYTTPKEALNFVKQTGVDALAVSIGTAHGAYKSKPRLDIQRLSEIRSTLSTPLVLHGGSGLSDDDFRNTIANGIAKINIYTDLCNAANKAMQEGLASNECYSDIHTRKVEYVKKVAMEKIRLFGSAGVIK